MPDQPKPRIATDRNFLQDLAENNPWGKEVSADDVAAWFDLIWPRYALRGYSRHKKAITSWWSRCTWDELEKARERAANLSANEGLAKLTRDVTEAQTEHRPVVDFFSRLPGQQR